MGCTVLAVLITIIIAEVGGRSNYGQPEFFGTFDFVIVGAGSGGSVLANRLSENAEWNILLLEAGTDEIFLTDIPLLAPAMFITDYNWGYNTEPSSNKSQGYCLSMKKGRCNWPRGKAIGGTSVINFMIYNRGSKQDYDSWAAEGNPGWSYSEVLPFFIKSEKCKLKRCDPRYHGKRGYLDVMNSPYISPLRRPFLETAAEFGYPVNDPNGESLLGFSVVQANLRDGSRVSANKAFLKPIRLRSNLLISKLSRVTKIIIEPTTKRAMGVEFVRANQKYIVRASKEVLLSAGTLNSPQILMLSGIGPEDHLRPFGIPVLQHLPVGYNLQDHVSMAALTFLVNDSVTIIESRVASNPINTLNYLFKGTGPLTVPGGAEGVAFINTDKANNHPDIELVLGLGAMTGDTSGSLRGIFGLDNDFFKQMFGGYEGADAFSIVPILLHPKSRGRIKLRSANPFHAPIFEPNYYDDERDIKTMIRGIKAAIKVGTSRAFQRFNATLFSRPLPGCENYILQSDEYWECVLRHISTTLGHFVGTCKMGPKEFGGVVDHELKVHGVKGLRVVDASIMPKIIAGHTNAPTYMIGEKASDMIKRDWAFFQRG